MNKSIKSNKQKTIKTKNNKNTILNENNKTEDFNKYYRECCGEIAFNNILKFLVFQDIDEEGKVTFVVNNPFIRDWIISNYKDKIIKIVVDFFAEATFLVIKLLNSLEKEILLPIASHASLSLATSNHKNSNMHNITSVKIDSNKLIKNYVNENKINNDANFVQALNHKEISNINNKLKVINEEKLDNTVVKKIKKSSKRSPKTQDKNCFKNSISSSDQDSKNTKSIVNVRRKKKVTQSAVEKVRKTVNKNNVNPLINNVKNDSLSLDQNTEVIILKKEKKSIELEKFSNNLNENFTFENFVVGESNEFAFNAARKIAESNQISSASNPLFFRGSVGLGKTHLMHATALYAKKLFPKKKIAYMTAEKFMYQFITELKSKNIMNFKERCRSVDILMIDDVQFMSGKGNTQEEFFHTFNSLVESRKQLIFAADRPPSELQFIEDRIRSRLAGGLVVDINTTTFNLRYNILKKKTENLDIFFPKEVLEFIAENISSNIRELEGALNRIIAHYHYNNSPITIILVKDLLKDVIGSSSVQLSIRDIQNKVANYYNLKVSELNSVSKMRKIVRPRQIAIFLAKSLTSKSLVEIGKVFGGRDHTTVMYSVQSIQKNLKKNNDLASEIIEIKALLNK